MPRFLRWVILTLVVSGMIGITTRAQAQHGTLAPLSVPADTGRMIWGHQQFTRYTDIAACNEAARDAQRQAERTRAKEFVPYQVTGDTLPTLAIAVAQACVTQFPGFFAAEALPPMTPADSTVWWSVGRVALVLGDDQRAAQAFERAIAISQSPADRGQAVVKATRLYLTATPVRVKAAYALQSQFATLGTAQRVTHFGWYSHLLDYWTRQYTPDSLYRYATAMIALSQQMTATERDAVNAPQPYSVLLRLAGDEEDTTTQYAVLARMRAEVGSWREGFGFRFVDGFRLQVEQEAEVRGKSARVVKGTYWFRKHKTDYPYPGTAALLVKVPPGCGSGCLSFFTILRTMAEQYSTELDIVVVAQTQGFLGNSGVLSVEEEAKVVANYYQDFLRLPTALLVDVATTHKRTDGRVQRTSGTGAESFGPWEVILVDRNGLVRWVGNSEIFDRYANGQSRINVLIRRVLGR